LLLRLILCFAVSFLLPLVLCLPPSSHISAVRIVLLSAFMALLFARRCYPARESFSSSFKSTNATSSILNKQCDVLQQCEEQE